MHQRERRRNRKWLVLGTAGFLCGIVTLLFFRSLALASGSAAITILTIMVIKHVALLIAVGSPATAVFQSLKPNLRAFCGRPPEDED